jgi:transcriptional regulator with XRE-family HTH domain
MYNGLYELSGIDIIRQLGKRFIDYRKRMGYTQKVVALKSGLSIFTISTFENGSSTGITLASFVKLLRAIDSLDEIAKVSNAVANFRDLAVALDIEKQLIDRIDSDFVRL